MPSALAFVALPVLLQAAPAPRVLRLSDAVDAATRNQPALRQAHAQTSAASARADEARAPMLPQVTASASYQRVRNATVAVRPGAVTGTNTSGIDVWSFGVSGSQLLWDFGQSYERYRATDRLADAARETERTTSQSVLLDVRRAYFTARAQAALVSVARETVTNLERHLAQIEGFVRVGTRPEIDLAQARTDLANGRLALINAENGYDVAKAQLARAMGEPASAPFDVADDELPAIDGEDLAPSALAARATGQRPEVASLARQTEAQTHLVRSYRGGYGPSLVATAGAQEVGTALTDLGPAWNVGVALTWPLFQGGITRAQVREAEATLDAAKATLDLQKLQIKVDVEQAALSLRAAKAAQGAAADVVTNAKERLRLAEGRYAQGVGSAIELGDAQVAVTNAEAQLVQARFQLSAARADLLAALGQR